MKSFQENRKFIENEFENAVFDKNTGKSAEELFLELMKIRVL